ncbi:hypothetical protein [Cohnella hashimotonis]|uniref:Guanylate cyclase domain-containing protein n=1 Tax=Cohnella hashimotonis TaxID=2826895 RepID=A0ABT6TC11_9BACL|nr:hypothetical protein [Cohnella hashimotonis]MDI4643479.1 hypothetical protein [Cohnella hashimotonis]
MKGSKYRSITKSFERYLFRTNPLYTVLNTSSQKNAEETEIEKIITKELEEDFKIGGHVDFDYLLEQLKKDEDFIADNNRVTDVKFCAVFIDLRNFTRRAMFLEDPGVETLSEIADMKQNAISIWIKLARFYQGHIHSITGDGLMVLMGGRQPEDQDEWTLGARAFLFALRVLESNDRLNEELKQTLKSKGKESHIKSDNLLDIKVGVEYSPNTLVNTQGVIVNNNGILKAVGEVKATSFEVDFSAKLLGYYGDAKKQIENSPKYGRLLMVGEKYLELMEFNEAIDVLNAGTYEKQMYDIKQKRTVRALDLKEYKQTVLTIENVAALCNVYDDSEEARSVIQTIAREQKIIQHG